MLLKLFYLGISATNKSWMDGQTVGQTDRRLQLATAAKNTRKQKTIVANNTTRMEMEEEEDDDEEVEEGSKDDSKPSLPKKLKRPQAKTGPKKGSGNQAKWSRGDWYEACHTYTNLPLKMEQKKFLASDKSPQCFDGRKSQCVSFVRYLKQYHDKTLKPNEINSRSSKGQFPEVEKKLIAYIDMRADRFTLDNLGNSWGCLEEKAQEYATLLGITTGLFTASPGWITNCLKRNGTTQLNLHGEAGDMDPAKRAAIMDEWRTKEFWPLIEKYKIPLNCIYNADQTGLFYQKW
jgi:hypothetical protein